MRGGGRELEVVTGISDLTGLAMKIEGNFHCVGEK